MNRGCLYFVSWASQYDSPRIVISGTLLGIRLLTDPQLGTLPPTIETSFNNTSIISFDMEYADPAVPRHAISLLALKLHHWRSQHVRMIRHAANKFARLAGSGNARYLDIPF